MGAWIETDLMAQISGLKASHPTWVRGLKLAYGGMMSAISGSHPTWVRGLKLLAAIFAAAWASRTLRGCVD